MLMFISSHDTLCVTQKLKMWSHEKYINAEYTRCKKNRHFALNVNLVQVPLISAPTHCGFESLLSCHSRRISSLLVLFLAPNVTAECHMGCCITYLHIQSDVSCFFSDKCVFVCHEQIKNTSTLLQHNIFQIHMKWRKKRNKNIVDNACTCRFLLCSILFQL